MSEINLTQAEADALFALEKHRVDDTQWYFPTVGCAIQVPLLSSNRRESFILDLSRSRIDLLKGTYQNRARQVVALVRLDFGGAPHRNPDGQEIPSPHLHVYREGFGDKWALSLPQQFTNPSDRWLTLEEFMRYCNITQPPNIQRELFS